MGGRGITTSDTRILLVAASRATSNRSKIEFMMIIPPIPAFKLPSASNKSSRSVPQGRERHLQARWHTRPSLPPSRLPAHSSSPSPCHLHSFLGFTQCWTGHPYPLLHWKGWPSYNFSQGRLCYLYFCSFFLHETSQWLFSVLGTKAKSSAWLLSPYQQARPSSFPSLFLTTCPHSHMSSLAGSNYPGSKPFPPVMPHLPFPWEGPPAWPTVLSNHLFIL